MYTRKKYFMKGFLTLCLFLCSFLFLPLSISAGELQEERTDSDRAATAMDESGNIYELENENGTIAELPMADAVNETDDMPSLFSLNGLDGYIVNFNTKGNATTDYIDTLTGEPGYTNGLYGADAAYLGTEGNYVKFMLAGVTGKVLASQVQIVPASQVSCISYYAVSKGRLYHYISTNLTNSSTSSVLDNGPAPSYLKTGERYYSYDGHYFYTSETFNNMLTDYKSGTRNYAVNSSEPFYNYFQYLPLRSKTTYSAAELNTVINKQANSSISKMNNIGESLIRCQNTYGVNALITSGIAANESYWGKSSIAQAKNNLFGLNAVDSSPGTSANTFTSVDTCIKDFTETYMSKRYLNRNNWVYFGGFLGNKGSGINVKYASDPYWGEKAAAAAWLLDGNSGSKDTGLYTIGIKSASGNVNIRAESTTNSSLLYNTGIQPQSSYLVLNQKTEGNFYKIQSDSVINGSRNGIDSTSGSYDFTSMYAYIHADYITLVSKGMDVPSSDALVEYSTHVQEYGWQNFVADGNTAGTSGESKRLEGIKIKLVNPKYAGSIQYSTHIQDYGWQDFVADGNMAGTSGESKRLEAIKIQLTGEMANHYDVYYRVHAQTLGWMDWAKNGACAGTAGYSYRLEAIQIQLVPKGNPAPGSTGQPFRQAVLQYSTHVQEIGWQNFVADGQMSGTSGESKRLEAIRIQLASQLYSGDIEYKTHVQDYGWQNFVKNGEMSGTSGESKRLEAIQIRLTGKMAEKYDIYYRVHSETFGWMGWAKNGDSAGTSGYSYRLEGIEIQLIPKGSSAPGSTSNSYISR